MKITKIFPGQPQPSTEIIIRIERKNLNYDIIRQGMQRWKDDEYGIKIKL